MSKYQSMEGGCGAFRGGRRGLEMRGGCGGYMEGGAFSEEAKIKSRAWLEEVKAVKAEHPENDFTYKDAMIEASRRRREANPDYVTSKSKYEAGLKNKSKSADYTYKPREHKNRHPLTMDAAERVLLQYYRDRANNYKNPMSAMRRKMSGCRAEGNKKLLYACESNELGDPIVTEKCKNSYRYRATDAKHSGPGAYSIDGLDNLCAKTDKSWARHNKSKLYNKSRILSGEGKAKNAAGAKKAAATRKAKKATN